MVIVNKKRCLMPKDKTNLWFIAMVAIVAIVAIMVLVTNS